MAEDAAQQPPSSADLWEEHARWWIDGFTSGADPEYDEQILPLAAAELVGATRVLDVGCGEGQVSRLAARLGVEAMTLYYHVKNKQQLLDGIMDLVFGEFEPATPGAPSSGPTSPPVSAARCPARAAC